MGRGEQRQRQGTLVRGGQCGGAWRAGPADPQGVEVGKEKADSDVSGKTLCALEVLGDSGTVHPLPPGAQQVDMKEERLSKDRAVQGGRDGNHRS